MVNQTIDTSNSRAEKAAEQMVSLSPEKIISILQQEPGLLLQVKKMLVRKAYEQGRILDPQELTDEALYRLIRQDENIRVIATREIEDREYVRVKPSKEELENEQQQRGMGTYIPSSPSQQQSSAKTGRSQEDEYWQRRDYQNGYGNGYGNGSRPLQQQPGGDQKQQNPQNTPVDDQRRAVERAQSQFGNGDYSSLESGGGGAAAAAAGGLPLDVIGGMQGISPDQLSALLQSRVGGQSSMSPASQLSAASLAGGVGSASGAGSGPSLPLFDQSQNDETPFPQQARLENPSRPSVRQFPSSRRDQPQLRHPANPYADVPSLYDLYSQYSQRPPVLERFGADVFSKGTGNLEQLPMDLPAGPDYVLGPGDGLSIDLWGAVSQRLRRVVDREGRVSLPEAGSIQVAGKTLGELQHMVQAALRTQFRDVQADVSLSRLRTVRVYVVGDVQNPGAYDVSSLSTPLNALYAAGGPTSRGSIRILKHYRGKELVQDLDVYDLLLHGIRSNMQRLEAGDTILIPPLGAEVTIEGMVRRPAIYELGGEKNLAEVLQLAGGVLPSGTLRHVDVERIQAHESRSMLALDVPETNNEAAVTKALEDFNIQDGDKVKISPIVAFADKTVYLDGHVFRPGKYAYRDGMKVSDLVASYKDILPEPYQKHAEVIRLKAPDYTPEVLAFDLDNALSGKDQDIVLKPFDTVRIFGRYDFEDSPVVTVSGEVRDPGDHVTNGATYLRDAIFLAGNTTPEARLDDVQIFRRTEDGKLKVLSANLTKALAGDSAENILLEPTDRVFVHRNLLKIDPATVTIEGEVGRPGKYPLGDNMSAADLVRLSGGLKRSAFTEQADLTRYTVEHGEKIIGDHQLVPIAKALSGEPDTDVRLHDGDVLTIRQLAGWNDRGASISVQGEVVHPGTYGIQEGERLSSVIERAGGFRADAYPYGIVFQRVQVRDLEEKNRSQLVRQVQQEGATFKTTSEIDPLTREAAMLQWKNTLEKLQDNPPAGRMVVHISSKTDRWKNTSSDIPVRAGDAIYIPKKPNLVMVDGAVYNPTAITYRPGRSAGWYLKQAGGPTAMANKRAIFVIRADGSVAGTSGGLFSGGLFSGGPLETPMQPGDMVVVPDRAFGGSFTWRNTLQASQLVSSLAIAAQVAWSLSR
ncbi:MAG: hypothetical protein NVSMB58_27070 [Terriglobales bacterium]